MTSNKEILYKGKKRSKIPQEERNAFYVKNFTVSRKWNSKSVISLELFLLLCLWRRETFLLNLRFHKHLQKKNKKYNISPHVLSVGLRIRSLKPPQRRKTTYPLMFFDWVFAVLVNFRIILCSSF